MPFKAVVSARGISFAVKVVPGASKSVIVGHEEEYLKIRLAAPAVNGKANRALIELLSEVLGVPKSSVQIRTGLASKRKLVQVDHPNAISLQRVLAGFSNLSLRCE